MRIRNLDFILGYLIELVFSLAAVAAWLNEDTTQIDDRSSKIYSLTLKYLNMYYDVIFTAMENQKVADLALQSFNGR